MTELASENAMNDQPKVQRIIEMKFPITWLIGFAMLLSSGILAVYTKFTDYGRDIQVLTATVNNLNAKTDTRDDRITAVVQEMIQVKAGSAALTERMSRAESDLKESRGVIEELRRNQRWMPK